MTISSQRAARASMQIHLGAGNAPRARARPPAALPGSIRSGRSSGKLVVELYEALTAPLDPRGTARRRAEPRRPAPSSAASAVARSSRSSRRSRTADPAQRRVAMDILGHLGNQNAASPLLGCRGEQRRRDGSTASSARRGRRRRARRRWRRGSRRFRTGPSGGCVRSRRGGSRAPAARRPCERCGTSSDEATRAFAPFR